MPLTLKLEHGGAYSSDIEEICRQIRENADRQKIEALDISHNDSSARLFINLAYCSNRGSTPNDSSLYIIGFRGADNVDYHFRGFEPMLPNSATFNASDGTYRQLGFANGFGQLSISRENLNNSIINVSNYRPEAGQDIRTDLTRLIIVSSESARSYEVREGVESALKPSPNQDNAYRPQHDWNVIHNWGGRSLSR